MERKLLHFDRLHLFFVYQNEMILLEYIYESIYIIYIS